MECVYACTYIPIRKNVPAKVLTVQVLLYLLLVQVDIVHMS